MISSTENEGQIITPGMNYWGSFSEENIHFGKHAHIFMDSSDKSKLEFVQMNLPEQINATVNPNNSDSEGEYERWRLNIRTAVNCFRFSRWILPFLDYRQAEVLAYYEALQQRSEVIKMIAEEGQPEELMLPKLLSPDEPRLFDPERVAAIFDASSGHGVYPVKVKDGTTGRIEYRVYCKLASIQQGLLIGLYNEYGGIKPVKYGRGINGNQSYLWQVNGYAVGRLLADIEPYLVLSKEVDTFILDFLTSKQALSDRNDPLIKAERIMVLEGYIEKWRNIRSTL